ncbi:MAG: polysaccharide biosynthesis/export family protein [Acidobacteriota bacterium]
MFRKVVILSLLTSFPALLAQSPSKPTAPTGQSPAASTASGQGSGGQSSSSNRNWNQRIQELSFTAASTDYRLGPGDLITVDVFGIEGFGRNLRVSSTGTITLPYIGVVEAAGLTTAELEQELSRTLDGRFIKNPQVSVFVVEYRSQSVFVLGAVQRPGQYQITSPLRLVDAIGLAGGLNLEAADNFAIIQKKGATSGPAENAAAMNADAGQTSAAAPKVESVRVNLKDLLENGNMALNVQISGGDVVQVPERQIARYYVIGDVNRPGAYELPREENMFLSQALAEAGGPMRTAKASKAVLVRWDENGQRKELPVDVAQILKGKKPDLPLQANDVLFLPGSTAKSIGYGLLGVIPGTLSNTVVWGTVRR